VAELVGVHDRPDRLDATVYHVERQHRDQPALPVVAKRAGLPVHRGRLQTGADPPSLLEERAEEPSHAHRAVDRFPDRLGLATTVADGDGVRSQELEQPVHVALEPRGEEPPRQLVALLDRRLEPWRAGLDPLPRAGEQLSAVRLALIDDLRDRGVVVLEDLAEQEHRALDRLQVLEEHEEGHRE
jgi:hypothetical protein